MSYALVPWACHGGPPVAIHLTNLVALAVVPFAGALAWGATCAPPAGRSRTSARRPRTASAFSGWSA